MPITLPTLLLGLALAAPQPGTLAVHVFGPTGRPVANYAVVVEQPGAAVFPISGMTNKEGGFRASLEPGAYEVSVTSPEGITWTLPEVWISAAQESELIVDWTAPDITFDLSAPEPTPNLEQPPQTEKSAQLKGALNGVVRSLTDAAPIADARVIVRGHPGVVVTDGAGRYKLELPEGTYALSVVHPQFSAEVHEGVVVKAGQTQAFDIQLSPAAVELGALVVTAPHIAGSLSSVVDLRKSAHEITEVLGAEQMARAGDSDAASALRRVTGITLVGGRYVYVRGLGERYSSTLLNGAGLPSPEPERRVVPLDLFPSSVLQAVVVRKTYSPDLPGEFGGGTVALQTRAYPEAFLLKLGVSTGAILGQTFTRANQGQAQLTDPLGVDVGARALPDEVREASANGKLLERDRFSNRGYTPEELEAFGESMPDTWQLTPQLLLPKIGLSAELGDRFHVGELEFGYLAALNYGHSSKRRQYTKRYLLLGAEGLEVGHAYDFDVATRGTDLGGIFTAGAELGNAHKLTLTSLIGRITDDEARIYQGQNRDVGAPIAVTRLRWVERTLLSEQLRGEHTFSSMRGLGIDWRYTFSLALRHEPDRREVRYDNEPGTDRWLLSDRPEGNQRLFSDLKDRNHDAGLSVSLPFTQWNGLDAKIAAGANATVKTRGVDTRRYKFMHKGERSRDSKLLARAPEQVFVPENIGPGGFQFEEMTRETDNYTASQSVFAAWTLLELPLWQDIDLSGGVRVERSTQSVETFELFNPDQTPVAARLATTDVLPGATLTFSLPAEMKLRFAGGATVSRPDFRELSPATFNDVTGGRQVFGNPDLERARIYAADARWEWYPTGATSLSAGLYYKHFSAPIEQVVVLSAQQSVTYANAKNANNLGAEIEGRLDGDVVHPLLKGLYVAGNASLTWSRVSLADTGIQTSSARPLQGQSPWVLNLQTGYSNDAIGLDVTALYNVFGRRIAQVGAQGAPDVYERPFHQLDLVVKQKLAKGFSLSLSASNLIDLPATWTQGDLTLTEIRRGRAVSAGLSWTY